MSGYRCGNSIPFLSCKIHCAEPPPSNPPSSTPSTPTQFPQPGRCKSIPLFIPPKMPPFSGVVGSYKRKKKSGSERKEQGESVEQGKGGGGVQVK